MPTESVRRGIVVRDRTRCVERKSVLRRRQRTVLKQRRPGQSLKDPETHGKDGIGRCRGEMGWSKRAHFRNERLSLRTSTTLSKVSSDVGCCNLQEIEDDMVHLIRVCENDSSVDLGC